MHIQIRILQYLKKHLYLFLMKKWLKYLLHVIVVAVFWNVISENASANATDTVADFSVSASAHLSNISDSESEPCLPRQLTFASSHQVQSFTRRAACAQRHNTEFAKTGRIYNTSLRYLIQTISLNTYSSLTESAQRLLCLGKLII